MNKIELKHFKAFKDSLEIQLGGKGFLLYGENGTGKSSLFEAFKIIFFKERLE